MTLLIRLIAVNIIHFCIVPCARCWPSFDSCLLKDCPVSRTGKIERSEVAVDRALS